MKNQTTGVSESESPPEFIDVGKLDFAGFETPVAAFRSLLWAFQTRDTNTMLRAFSLNGLPPEFREQIKPEDFSNFTTFGKIDGLVAVESIEELTPDLVLLKIKAPGTPTDSIPMERIGDDWKVRPTITINETTQ